MASVLEWEENLFLGFKALHRRLFVRPTERKLAAVRVPLEPLRQELFLLARMVAGRPVAIIETGQAVLCDDEHLFLPTAFDAAATSEANEELYRIKALLGALAMRPGDASRRRGPLQGRLDAWAQEFPELPARIAALEPLLEGRDLWSLLGAPSPGSGGAEEARSARSAEPPAPDAAEEEITEIAGEGRAGVSVVEEPEDQPAESEMPTHTFEKAETLEESNGVDRKTDEEDELEEHEEALRTLEMTQVMRSRERPRSIYRADIVIEGPHFEIDEEAPSGGIPYPEWDYKKRRHKPDWCFVRPTRAQETDLPWAEETARKHRALVLDLKKKLASLATRLERSPRRPHGDDLDLDAVVRAQVDRRAGQPPDERLYVERRRRRHDVSALILMDLSFSTDSWIDDARVLDTMRETLFCAGEVLDEFIGGFAVAGFSSNTRRQCGFHLIKDFHEDWRGSRARLGALVAQGYTRIGPALRHAQELLEREPGERKIVFLLTDGRPCDYDRYEGEYGIRDVRKAIETGARHGIATHAFAIEKRSREQFPRMFKRQHYDVVPSPAALVASLCGAFARLRLED